VDKTSKDSKTVLDKFYDGVKNYKTKKPLEDLSLVGMCRRILVTWRERYTGI
jgi:hypothetical protein